MELEFNITSSIVSPFREMAAYEALWNTDKASFKKIAELFAKVPNSLPSNYIDENQIKYYSELLKQQLIKNSNIKPNIIINSTYDYPQKLRDAVEPIEVLYYCGDIEYLNTRGVAIVGSRHPSDLGIRRAVKLVRLLVEDNITIFSGLAEGIDTVAHLTAIENKGKTVAVIGTPLNEFYPKKNKELQLFIAKNHLLVSQVPFIKYSLQDYRWNRGFFPERNKTMSALSEATVIIEASETSGTLIQAKAALAQGRKLFILQNCFENKSITWPEKFEKLGAIRVREYEDLRKHLGIL
ncbi:DNA-processing protein DprA [Bacteroides ovatus]|jgi:DNA processing protein|nr:DNA-processing protein DprA [Bacteroides ovatus]KAA4680774.1 DNA-processing protein DprA [Bacteroides ovatus]